MLLASGIHCLCWCLFVAAWFAALFVLWCWWLLMFAAVLGSFGLWVVVGCLLVVWLILAGF